MDINWKNKEWMQFFHQERDLWEPMVSEWQRLLKEYIRKRQNDK